MKAMRVVVASSQEKMQELDPVAKVEEWPLLVKSDGQPMGKGDMACFYTCLAQAAGLPELWLPPHAARVTGAVSMALAGLSEWTIQVFCRWGSPTVLRYVRDALLGHRGSMLRRSAGSKMGPSLGDLRECAKREAHATGVHHQPLVTEDALEQLVEAAIRKSREEQGDVTRELLQKISALGRELQDVKGRLLPAAAKCERGRWHTVRTASLAHCSWKWAAVGAQEAPEMAIPDIGSEEALRNWCSKCLRRRDIALGAARQLALEPVTRVPG